MLWVWASVHAYACVYVHPYVHGIICACTQLQNLIYTIISEVTGGAKCVCVCVLVYCVIKRLFT